MKTPVKFFFVLVFALGIEKMNAQTFDNLLSCDVQLFIEEWDQTTSCSVCTSGYYTVPANSTGNTILSGCGNDACIIIVDIGGCSVPTNHRNLYSLCHNIVAYGQSGSIGGCCTQTTFVVTWNGSSWVIQ